MLEGSQAQSEEFEVNYLIAGKLAEEKLIVRVDLYEYVVKYTLVERSDKWSYICCTIHKGSQCYNKIR